MNREDQREVIEELRLYDRTYQTLINAGRDHPQAQAIARERVEQAEARAEQQRGHLDYIRRILHGALVFIDTNQVPVNKRLRNNVQNALHDIDAQLTVR